MRDDPDILTPELLLHAYASGVFPMSEGRGVKDIFWVDPRRRGILPLEGFHISRSLARQMRREEFEVSFDTDFTSVVAACADRPETWINDTISDLYQSLFESGYAHSVEVWRQGKLIGGSYGVALGAAYFGESMFSRETGGSKIALAFLVDRLREGGFELFDTQFLTDHLATLGAIEVSRSQYRALLHDALRKNANFNTQKKVPNVQDVLQRNIQTS